MAYKWVNDVDDTQTLPHDAEHARAVHEVRLVQHLGVVVLIDAEHFP